MNSRHLLLTGMALCASYLQAFHLHAGQFRAAGGSVTVNGTLTASDTIIEAPATLRGNGNIVGDVLVRGTASPGDASPTSVGMQTIAGAMTFETGSVFECYAADHTSLDRINASDTVTGNCTVALTLAASAVPVSQVIVSAGPLSDFDGFAADDPATWQLAETGSVDLILTHLSGDSDWDQMPDWWEIASFAHRTSATPSGNADSDLHNNLEEFIAYTDPNDPEDYLHIVSVSNLAPVYVAFTSQVERSYTLSRSTNLFDGVWTDLAGQILVPGKGGPDWMQDTDAPGNVVFYRIKASLP